MAFDLDFGVPGLESKLNTDLRYAIGVRTTKRDSAIGNNHLFDEGDYRFDRGDVVTNRLDATPQLSFSYSPEVDWLSSIGVRISGNGFYDFAYTNNDVQARPGTAPVQLPSGLLGSDQEAIPFPVAPNPRVPYSDLTGYESGKYNSKAKSRNVRDAEIQDMFVSANFSLGDTPLNLKVGQHALFWGEALFNPFFGVSYSQGPIDINKALTIPAINAIDLFIPVNRVSGNIVPLDVLSIGFEYYLDWRPVRAPEGGTYLSTGDPFLDAPERLFLGNLPGTGPYFSPHVGAKKGKNDDAFGIQVKYDVLESTTLGFYYRQFDETLPWVHVSSATPENQPGLFGNIQSLLDALTPVIGPITGPLPVLPGTYRYVYPRNTKLYGVSFNSKVFGLSLAGEVVYNENRALLSEILNREDTGEKARGDMWSGVLNVLDLENNVQLFGIPLWDQSVSILEFNWSYLDKVTERKDVYKKTNSQSCRNDAALFGAPGVKGSTIDWCASDYHVGMALVFLPTWYRVAPGIDLNALVFYQNVLKNTSAANLAAAEGFGNGSFGVGMIYRQSLQLSLNYNFFFSDYRKGQNVDGETQVTSFNGLGIVEDRDYVSLTAKYSF